MTDVLPERETLTQPIAQRRYTPAIYDCNATAVIRPDEYPILDLRSTGEMPRVLDAMFQEPPTGPVPPPPPMPAPESLMKPGREPEYFSPERPRRQTGKRRMPAPWWTHALWGGGLGVVLGALLVGIPVAALVTR